MRKKCYRFFGGLLSMQENWLNKMAQKGYRLIRAEKLLYEFEKCRPNSIQYCVDFIGYKSKKSAAAYCDFLEGLGYEVFYKNINLNYNVGKIRWRPWAEAGGRIARNSTIFNREILIAAKENDGKPFDLHTTYADKATYYKNLRNAWLTISLTLAIIAGFLSTINKNLLIVWGILTVISLIPGLLYQIEITKNTRAGKIREW